METDEKVRIAAKLAAARADLLAGLEGLEATDWDWRPADGRWSVRQTLAHVASAQWSHLEVIRAFLVGQRAEIQGFDLDNWNAARVAERDDWSVERVLADLEAGHRAALALLERLDDRSLAIAGRHPALGEVRVAQVLRILALHDAMHRRDIAALRSGME